MDEEFRAGVQVYKLVDCLGASSPVVSRQEWSLIPSTEEIAERPGQEELDRRHQDVELHSRDDDLTGIKEPVWVEIFVNTLWDLQIIFSHVLEIPCRNDWHENVVNDTEDEDRQHDVSHILGQRFELTKFGDPNKEHSKDDTHENDQLRVGLQEIGALTLESVNIRAADRGLLGQNCTVFSQISRGILECVNRISRLFKILDLILTEADVVASSGHFQVDIEFYIKIVKVTLLEVLDEGLRLEILVLVENVRAVNARGSLDVTNHGNHIVASGHEKEEAAEDTNWD